MEFGDLPENAAWDATTKEERQNELRIAELRDVLDRAEVLPDNIPDACPDSVGTVADVNDRLILDINGKKEKLQLLPISPEQVRATSSQPLQPRKMNKYHFLSVDSLIGLAVFGKKENFQAKIDTPDGAKTIRIVTIVKG